MQQYLCYTIHFPSNFVGICGNMHVTNLTPVMRVTCDMHVTNVKNERRQTMKANETKSRSFIFYVIEMR